MRILLLGGTAWLGRATAEAAIAAGHDVTCLARTTRIPADSQYVHADRNADDALAVLPEQRWDAVVDVATEPVHVRRAVRDLVARADRYVFVSSCNVYASLAAEGIEEDAPLHGGLAAETMSSPQDYGPAKVAGEQAVLAGFGPERAVIIRPGLIGGPGDPTGRSTYWPLRFARPANPHARVLVPDAFDQPTAMIDVRDLAGWIVQLVEHRAHGIFNAVGDVMPLGTHLDIAREAAGHTGPLLPAAPSWLGARRVGSWMVPRSLPLWLDSLDVRGIGALSNARARTAGLAPRPLSHTLTDILAAAAHDRVATATGAGLTDEEENRLLSELTTP